MNDSSSDYRQSKVRWKKLIKTAKESFLRKALSSKKPKEVWDAVNRIINPSENHIRQNASKPTNYFTTLASVSLERKMNP